MLHIQSTAAPSLFDRIFFALSEKADAIVEVIRQRRLASRTRGELRRLSPAQLSDIGLSPADIDDIVSRAVLARR